MLDDNFGLIELLKKQLATPFTFGDVLVARAGGKVRANTAAASGRSVEDEIEAVVESLGLPYQTRTKFVGQRSQRVPCDLVIPNGANALIVVAAKGLDSTGSKLTEAVREVQEVATYRKPSQMVCAVIDGMGWASRRADLQNLYNMWDNDTIDGFYTLSSLDRFRADVESQARIRGLLA